ncbi:hypothetical protein RRG08_005605 [Elysia crispata]|uniref:Uncharacterized protein n=1 Tax=Elysia crispata TaxID=231223 RepID=A0AAE0YXG7_9GAST|nr:hypothetical protein RRG08_005605 [Elysia crispata]
MQTFSQPHFLYCYQTSELQLTALTFVKALRTADFKLYLEVLLQLIPWVFALDRIHYARNLPIHLRDMIALEELHPAIHNEFIAGRFVGQKTNNAFSSIALDQMSPTKDALFQHTLRAAYQAGQVWGQALITCPDLPEPSQWGWMKKETSWAPLWTTMPPISKGLKDLVTCQCKKMCKPPCLRPPKEKPKPKKQSRSNAEKCKAFRERLKHDEERNKLAKEKKKLDNLSYRLSLTPEQKEPNSETKSKINQD